MTHVRSSNEFQLLPPLPQIAFWSTQLGTNVGDMRLFPLSIWQISLSPATMKRWNRQLRGKGDGDINTCLIAHQLQLLTRLRLFKCSVIRAKTLI